MGQQFMRQTTGAVLEQEPLGIATKKSTGSMARKMKAADTGTSVKGYVQKSLGLLLHILESMSIKRQELQVVL